MKRIIVFFAVTLLLCSCAHRSIYASIKVPDEHYPSKQIAPNDLSAYQIAFCVGINPDLVNADFQQGGKIVNLYIRQGDKSINRIISTNDLRIHPSPYIQQKQEGHPKGDDVGCIDGSGSDIRFNSNEIFWMPNSNKFAFVSGINPFTADYHLFEILDSSSYREEDPPITHHDYNSFFSSPKGIYWSPTADKFATVVMNTQMGNTGSNIWVYDLDKKALSEITHFTRPGNDVATAAWSKDGKKLAIGYGGPASGVAIATIGNQNQYVEVTSNTYPAVLHQWRYWITSSWLNFARAFYDGKNSTENFNGELAFNSTPVWINNDQQVIFVASNAQDRASLFIVNADGTELRELIPNLPGIVLMPTISPDGNILTFARYAGWKDRSRVEIAIFDLESKQLHSVAVFPRLADKSVLFVSGMDWSPDGKYFAFSVPYKKESDIFLVTRDGDAWINFTQDIEGDAVSPSWKP